MPAFLASLQHLPIALDIALFCFLLLAAIAYGLLVGRDRTVMVLLSVYLALAVVTNAPILALVNQWLRIQQHPTLRLVWFMGLFLAIFLIMWRSHILRGMATERGAWHESTVFGILQVGLAVSIALFLLPWETTNHLSPAIQAMFLSDIGRSFWLVAPIVALSFLGRNGKRTLDI